jgi:hypothetical protein
MNLEVVKEQRFGRGVDGHDALAAAFRPPDAALEVDVLPVEAEQLASPQPA